MGLWKRIDLRHSRFSLNQLLSCAPRNMRGTHRCAGARGVHQAHCETFCRRKTQPVIRFAYRTGSSQTEMRPAPQLAKRNPNSIYRNSTASIKSLARSRSVSMWRTDIFDLYSHQNYYRDNKSIFRAKVHSRLLVHPKPSNGLTSS